MNRLRLATEEEIAKIKDTSDLGPTCYVLALDTQQGTILGVVRMPVEVDPVYFPEGLSDKLKLFFMRDIETHLSAKGAMSYYFNIVASEENQAWIDTAKNFGAQQVSKVPELRFMKPL